MPLELLRRTLPACALLFLGTTAPALAAAAKAKMVAAGTNHNCALLDDGRVKCWGFNGSGQLGIGNTTMHGINADMGDNLPAVDFGGGRTAKAIAAGGASNFAILSDGSLTAWGDNTLGQLGVGDLTNRGDKPADIGHLPTVDLGDGRTATAISASNGQTCAILDDQALKCWGYNGYGELGLGDTDNRIGMPHEIANMPAVNLGTGRHAIAISSGTYFTCALLDDHSARCWGLGANGQLGIGSLSNVGEAPEQMGDHMTAIDFGPQRYAVSIQASYNYACAILDDGSIKCWGDNTFGQAGVGDDITRGGQPNEMGASLPVAQIAPTLRAEGLSCTSYHCCAVMANAATKCWGYNFGGELGTQDPLIHGVDPAGMGDGLPFVDLGNLAEVKTVVTGQYHSCALLGDGAIKCWGLSNNGQLGRGDGLTNGVGASSDGMGSDLINVNL